MNALISKARRPKFELSLKVIDLNNVPLVSGTSFIKWHLPSSTSAEHRGRTEKAVIKDHKVVWDYKKVLPVRLTMDKTNQLQECVIDFEVVQDYSGGRGEKITLGRLSLNLAEYVDVDGINGDVEEEGYVTRRYLMQESKINSTLKIGIAMRQIDGERNFVAPPLKTAPVFGGIAGIMAGEQGEQDDMGHMSITYRTREAGELQDMYRRALAASWAAQAGELPADQCVEDIFSGGNGWRSKNSQDKVPYPRVHRVPGDQMSDEEDEPLPNRNLLHHPQERNHRRTASGSSTGDKRHGLGNATAKSVGAGLASRVWNASQEHMRCPKGHKRGGLSADMEDAMTEHLESVMGHEPEKIHGLKRAHEVNEFDVMDDLTAWQLPTKA